MRGKKTVSAGVIREGGRYGKFSFLNQVIKDDQDSVS